TAFHRVAAAHGVSPQQVALAWLLTRSPAVIPVPGASRPASILDSVGATELELSEAERNRLDAPLPG
ncbi:aldo/keto reductase, partial [Streptomyces anthocyanicus]